MIIKMKIILIIIIIIKLLNILILIKLIEFGFWKFIFIQDMIILILNFIK
jgi:hypothetical protein